MDESEQTLFAQLRSQPLVEISGVVDASGGGGCMMPDDGLWTFLFSFAAWRVGANPIQESELIVRCQVTEEEQESLSKRVSPNTLLSIRGRVALENIFDRPEALLEDIIGLVTTDSELADCRNGLLKPVVRHDAQFGEFILDRSVTTFNAVADWLGVSVVLSLSLNEVSEFDDALNATRTLWSDANNWNHRVTDCLAKDVLRLKSENWREEDGSSVDRKQFESRIKLKRIAVRRDGDIEFWYDDDRLFLGHDIAAIGNLSGELSGGIHG